MSLPADLQPRNDRLQHGRGREENPQQPVGRSVPTNGWRKDGKHRCFFKRGRQVWGGICRKGFARPLTVKHIKLCKGQVGTARVGRVKGQTVVREDVSKTRVVDSSRKSIRASFGYLDLDLDSDRISAFRDASYRCKLPRKRHLAQHERVGGVDRRWDRGWEGFRAVARFIPSSKA